MAGRRPGHPAEISRRHRGASAQKIQRDDLDDFASRESRAVLGLDDQRIGFRQGRGMPGIGLADRRHFEVSDLVAAELAAHEMPAPANGERRHFVRGKLSRNEIGYLEVAPISETDSGHSSSLAEADALIIQPEDSPGLAAGEIVEIIPLNFLS